MIMTRFNDTWVCVYNEGKKKRKKIYTYIVSIIKCVLYALYFMYVQY